MIEFWMADFQITFENFEHLKMFIHRMKLTLKATGYSKKRFEIREWEVYGNQNQWIGRIVIGG